MNEAELYLSENIQYTELVNGLQKALDFYGNKVTGKLLKQRSSLHLNDKTSYGNKKLGYFYPIGCCIELFQVKDMIANKSVDVVFVHELAHFIDRINVSGHSRYKYASSIRGSKERIVAECFRNYMFPFPQKRTNYRGRTCELFARAIEEYYAISVNSSYILTSAVRRQKMVVITVATNNYNDNIVIFLCFLINLQSCFFVEPKSFLSFSWVKYFS